MTLRGAQTGRELIGLLMTSGPDRRHQLKARADRASGSAGGDLFDELFSTRQ
jgi:hypothetical protein